MALILVRHGRTAANAQGRLLGRADPDLDHQGRRQAAAIATALGAVPEITSSPLRRARHTASVITAAVEVDERWVEIDYGDYDELPLSEVPSSLWTAWRRDPTYAPPGGESLADVGRRVRAACRDMAARAAVEDVVVVTHVSPIKAAVAWALGVGEEVAWRLHVGVGSVTRIVADEAGPVLRSFNETHHLPALEEPAQARFLDSTGSSP